MKTTETTEQALQLLVLVLSVSLDRLGVPSMQE